VTYDMEGNERESNDQNHIRPILQRLLGLR
jgi:hypothetical protein